MTHINPPHEKSYAITLTVKTTEEMARLDSKGWWQRSMDLLYEHGDVGFLIQIEAVKAVVIHGERDSRP